MSIAILFSGNGSNMMNLIKQFPKEIIIAASDNVNAKGFKKLDKYNSTKPWYSTVSNTHFSDEEDIRESLIELDIKIVCLAGYMKIVSKKFIDSFKAVINIHPSLLPAFKGLNTHERALKAGVKYHGCTVHYVTEKLDDGPIIEQAVVPVMPGDTAEILASRTLKEEHRIYPIALRKVINGLK